MPTTADADPGSRRLLHRRQRAGTVSAVTATNAVAVDRRRRAHELRRSRSRSRPPARSRRRQQPHHVDLPHRHRLRRLPATPSGRPGAGSDVGGCFSPITGSRSSASSNTGASLAAGARSSIRFAGVTNPTDRRPNHASASARPATPSRRPRRVHHRRAAGTLSAVTRPTRRRPTAAGARTNYRPSFTTSATGGALRRRQQPHHAHLPHRHHLHRRRQQRRPWSHAHRRRQLLQPQRPHDRVLPDNGATVAAGAPRDITLRRRHQPDHHRPTRRRGLTTSDPGAVNSAPFTVVTAGHAERGHADQRARRPAPPARAPSTRPSSPCRPPAGSPAPPTAASRSPSPPAPPSPAASAATSVVGATDVGSCFSPTGLAHRVLPDTGATVAPGAPRRRSPSPASPTPPPPARNGSRSPPPATRARRLQRRSPSSPPAR